MKAKHIDIQNSALSATNRLANQHPIGSPESKAWAYLFEKRTEIAAWEEGFLARREYEWSAEFCPYRQNTTLAKAWVAGWNRAGVKAGSINDFRNIALTEFNRLLGNAQDSAAATFH